MRQNNFVLPAFAMGLLYSSIYLGLIIINLRGSASSGQGDFGLFIHFALIAITSLILYYAAKKGRGWIRSLAVLLALVGVLLITLPFLPSNLPEKIFNGHPPIMAMGMALFIPVGLFLFFRNVPTRKAGFAFALILACSELLWALLFPLLGSISIQLHWLQAFHLFSLYCWMLGGAGLCLAISLARNLQEPVVVAPDTAVQSKIPVLIANFAPKAEEAVPFAGGASFYETKQEEKDLKAFSQKTSLALCLIFTACMSVFTLIGLHMGMFIPKTAVQPEFINIVHFTFLVLLPIAGRMLDEKPSKLMLMCIPALAAVLLMSLLYENNFIDKMPLFYMLNFMQSILLLIAYATTAKLMKTHTAFPLLIPLAHYLYILHAGGLKLRGLVEVVPYGVMATSLLLALGAASCLWGFRRLLTNSPQLWDLPKQKNTPMMEPEVKLPHNVRLAAISAYYGLGERETQVLDLLMQGIDDLEAAKRLEVKKATIRTTIHRIKEKTKTTNRQELTQLSIR